MDWQEFMVILNVISTKNVVITLNILVIIHLIIIIYNDKGEIEKHLKHINLS